MALALAVSLFLFMAVLIMIAAAVVALFVWNGAIWVADSHCSSAASDVRREPNLPATSLWPQHEGLPCKSYAARPPVCRASQQVASIDLELEPAKVMRSEQEAGVVEYEENLRVNVLQAPVNHEVLVRGYASQLACKFRGNHAVHAENVAAVVSAYELPDDDICYCFLCLEEVANADGGAGLSLKMHGVGPYAARVWVVALARFVRAAQRHAEALEDGRVIPLCNEWQYQCEHFLGEVRACEAPFQRKHGNKLLKAFQQEHLRRQEVARAQWLLSALSAAAGTRDGSIASAKGGHAASVRMGALPALPSAEGAGAIGPAPVALQEVATPLCRARKGTGIPTKRQLMGGESANSRASPAGRDPAKRAKGRSST